MKRKIIMLLMWSLNRWVHHPSASTLRKNVHMLCCRLWLPINTRHRSEYRASCPRHGIVFLLLIGLKGNLIIGCNDSLFFLSLWFVPQQSNLRPLARSCQPCEHNIKCSRQSVGLVWFLLHQVLAKNWGEWCLGFGAKLFWLRWVRAQLYLLWHDMFVFLQLLLYVTRHWYVHHAVDIVPIEGDVAV